MNKIIGLFVLAVMLVVPTIAPAASEEVPAGFIAVSEKV